VKVIRNFPLYVVIILWVQLRYRQKQPQLETKYSLAERRGWLERAVHELSETEPGFVQTWLISRINKDLSAIILLQQIGFLESGYVKK
jgi:hypothetical protein